MREILFRGKRIDNGEWVYGYYCGPVGIDASNEICDINDSTGSRLDVNPDTVGQYTGLTDNNGKKIFEGDIVELDDGEIGCVLYRDSGFALSSGGCSLCVSSRTERVIIGNIHDNPELVGGAEDAAD